LPKPARLCLAEVGRPLRVPEPEPADEGVLVVSPARDRRQLVELVRPAAAEHDIVGLDRRHERRDRLEHFLPPLFLADPLERPLADVVLERLLLERQVAELHRQDDTVRDQRRAEAGAEPEEEHPSTLVAADRLHDGIVDEPRRHAEDAFVVEADPALAEVDRLGDGLAAAHRGGDADADSVERPAVDEREHAVGHLAGGQVGTGRELSLLALLHAREQGLDVRAADVDGQDRAGHAGIQAPTADTGSSPDGLRTGTHGGPARREARSVNDRGETMSSRKLVFVLLALVAAGAAAAGIAVAGQMKGNNKDFEYAVGLWGDLPYNDVQAQTGVPNLIADMNNSDISFSIHDGDLKAGSGTAGSATPTTCSDALYQQSLNYLNSLEAPAFFTPGDNDWTDC